jgi:hypothetical protein
MDRGEEGELAYSMKWMRYEEVMGSEEEGEEGNSQGTKEGRAEQNRESNSPLTMKPLISSLNRLTSHDTNTPPAGMLRIVWLLGSQDPIPDTTDTGRHLMRMESEDKGGSEAEETREELTMREMGIIFPETEDKKDKEARRGGRRIGDLFSCLGDSQQGLPSQSSAFLHHQSWHRNRR